MVVVALGCGDDRRHLINPAAKELLMDCIKEKNLSRCNCTYEPCPRKGNCCECLAYHAGMRQLPACVFPVDAEKTFDRSFEHFARLVLEKRV